RETAMERAEPLLQTFRLKQELGIFPSHFSKGMKQKVMIICAFIVNPELYIIDEPFLGLDPLGIQSMLDLMVEKKEEGRTVLMSTHILATAEKYCDRFIILDKGEIVAIGDLASLQSQTGMTDKTLDEIYIHVTQGGQQS
ncbi:AAA family ATPase, partial [Staphylococcus arlettae]